MFSVPYFDMCAFGARYTAFGCSIYASHSICPAGREGSYAQSAYIEKSEGFYIESALQIYRICGANILTKSRTFKKVLLLIIT